LRGGDPPYGAGATPIPRNTAHLADVPVHHTRGADGVESEDFGRRNSGIDVEFELARQPDEAEAIGTREEISRKDVVLLPLIHFRPRYGLHKSREFVPIQLPVMISVSTRKLHFQESKYLVLRHCLGRCNRSHVILDCHENLRPQKGPFKSWANHAIAVSWTFIITQRARFC
jgi:hypothetical protein